MKKFLLGKRLVIGLILVLLAAGGLGVWYTQANGSHRTTFKTATVDRGSLQATISATGTVEPEEVIDVGAQVAGQIKFFGRDPTDSSKPIDYNSPVEENTVLAQIDDALYQAQVDQAKANVQKAEADLLQMKAKVYQTERDWKRAQQLVGRTKGVISDLDYDTSLATYETAKSTLGVGEAGVTQAKAALHQAEINLGYTTVRSPVKGVIIDRRVNIGQTVVASLNAPSLFLIAKDLKRMQIWASVNEADIGQIKAGQPVSFTVDAAPGDTFRGEVSMIRLNATMTQNVVTYTVVVSTDNSHLKLKPYATANLQFEVSKHDDVLLVPNAAVRWTPQTQQVAPDARDAFEQSQRRKSVPPVPGAKPPAQADKEQEHHDHGILWVEDGGYVRPIKVRIGLSDGAMTEIKGNEVEENTKVVIGEMRQGSGEGTSNPFTPQLFGGRKQQ
jgi:HlyD family secretion protein